MSDEDTPHVFDTPDFWRSSRWFEPSLLLPAGGNCFIGLDVEANLHTPLPDGPALQLSSDGFFQLPPLLKAPPLELDPADFDKHSHALIPEPAQDVDDFWLLVEGQPATLPALRSWGHLDLRRPEGSIAHFITESSPEAFDSMVSWGASSDSVKTGRQQQLVEPSALCSCLLALALGRDSALFAWDLQKRSFTTILDSVHVSGCSTDVLRGINRLCSECGDNTRFLRSFVDRTYSTNPTPCKVAFANSVNVILATVQEELGLRGQAVQSLIQLQLLVRPVCSLLQFCGRIVHKVSKSTSEAELISLIFDEALSVEHGSPLLRDTVKEVLQAVSRPFLDFVEQWMGLATETGIAISKDGSGKSFVTVENRTWVDDMGFELEEPDYILDAKRMPNFIHTEVARSIFETGRNLRFLRASQPHHCLCNPNISANASPPRLQWLFDWQTISRVEHKAISYKKSLSRSIQRLASMNSQSRSPLESSSASQQDHLQFFGKDQPHIENRILSLMAELGQPLPRQATTSLANTVRRHLFASMANDTILPAHVMPPWSLTPLLSFGPIVSAQASVVSRECMKLLFHEHNIREHLSLLRNFQLFGNGLFCTRLTNTLFNPDLNHADRQAGVTLSGGVMGLRLEGRANWPPSSSELRLALMGLLSESYEPANRKTDPIRGAKQGLPGDLSFAVRDLSPEEMETCANPKAIEALDFLRLTYKPPGPLRPIMTPMVLTKLDRIFKLLLRTLRMLYVVKQLFRNGHVKGIDTGEPVVATYRFRLEARHFISSVAAYFFDVGITMPWQRFEDWLDRTQADLERPLETIDHSHSPDLFRERHESVLDEIMFTLLLRKKQQAVLGLLEDIFRVILQFAEWSRMKAGGRRWEGADEEAAALYQLFRKKLDIFITVCRAMGEKSGVGMASERLGHSEEVGENPISRLLLVLDMHGAEWRDKPATWPGGVGPR